MPRYLYSFIRCSTLFQTENQNQDGRLMNDETEHQPVQDISTREIASDNSEDVAATCSTDTTTEDDESVPWETHDLGHFLKKKKTGTTQITDKERYEWIKHVWCPPLGFKFPMKKEGTKNRAFQISWLKTHPWLVYSPSLNGGLCKTCVVFGRCDGGTNDVKLGKLVIEPLTSFKKATEMLKAHSNTAYHKANTVVSKNFLLTMEGKKHDVVTCLNTAEQALIEENKKKLIPIIKTIIFCGIQNIALRGHRDDGDLIDTKDLSAINDGNFRALLKFRIDSGDKDLEKHIRSCGKNSSYVSKTIQNELIQCCGELITQNIVSKVKHAKYFTLMADETTDIATKEQLSICIRYYDEKTFEICEDFIKFVDVVDLTGEGLCKTLLQELENLDLDITNCRGQAFDGGSNMSGKYQGVQARLLKIQPLAIYSHCASHRLNLVISKSCTTPSIRNAVGVITSVANYFRESAKRLHKLDEAMDDSLKKGKHAVKKLCETRWIDRHDAILTFVDSLPFLHQVLESIANSDAANGSNAFSFMHSILSSEFIISVVILADVFALTLPLAKRLQAVNIDVLKAMSLVDAILKTLQSHRDESTEYFKSLYKKAEDLASLMGTELKKPRTTAVQINRNNVQCESTQDYFRISVHLPFIDFIINELSTRFPKTQMIQIGNLQKLLPEKAQFVEDYETSVLKGSVLYQSDLPCFQALNGELSIWKHMWTNQTEKFPITPAEAIKYTEDLPNIKTLLQIICTLPVTTSTAERSFSSLRRLKTYLRSTMGEERLNGLASLHIHREEAANLSANEILNLFAVKKKTEE